MLMRLSAWSCLEARVDYIIKIDNISFERVEDFKYLATTLTNQNSVQDQIKSRLK
jgi:hypothetical protein